VHWPALEDDFFQAEAVAFGPADDLCLERRSLRKTAELIENELPHPLLMGRTLIVGFDHLE
jgi:hypothetical protein